MGFESQLAKLDGLVDAHLGEAVFISTGGGPAAEYKGFIRAIDEAIGQFDEVARIWTLRVSKAQIPVPDRQAVMTSDRLAGTWRCATWQTDHENPAYWLVKLEKAS